MEIMIKWLKLRIVIRPRSLFCKECRTWYDDKSDFASHLINYECETIQERNGR